MILVINTAFSTANLALETKDGCFYKNVNAKQGHSESVLPAIDALCAEAKIQVDEIDTIAVITGPGSFTGLRIGVSIAKALKCVNDKIKFIDLSSLKAMAYIIAHRKLADSNFACVINALSGLYFVCNFDKNGNAISQEQLLEGLDSVSLPKFALVDDLDDENVKFIEFSSEELLSYAKQEFKRKNFKDALEPHYLRLSQAEDNLLKKNKKSQKIS